MPRYFFEAAGEDGGETDTAAETGTPTETDTTTDTGTPTETDTTTDTGTAAATEAERQKTKAADQTNSTADSPEATDEDITVARQFSHMDQVDVGIKALAALPEHTNPQHEEFKKALTDAKNQTLCGVVVQVYTAGSKRPTEQKACDVVVKLKHATYLLTQAPVGSLTLKKEADTDYPPNKSTPAKKAQFETEAAEFSMKNTPYYNKWYSFYYLMFTMGKREENTGYLVAIMVVPFLALGLVGLLVYYLVKSLGGVSGSSDPVDEEEQYES
jgi:hypothetical protein